MEAISRIAWLFALGAFLALVGCAPTTVNMESQDLNALPQPEKFLVYNFAVAADEVKIDQGVSTKVRDLVNGTQTPRTDEERQVGHTVADTLARKLVAALRKMGYPAERAWGQTPVGGNTLLIEGQFLSINEGNRAERVVIGLGAGRSDVKVLTQGYQLLPSGRTLVVEFETDAKSGYKPGMLETEGMSAAAGHWAAGLAVGTGLAVAGEKFGANVEDDAERTASEVAKKMNDFFLAKGWIPTIPQQ